MSCIIGMVEVILKNGLKYKRNKKGHLKLLCIADECEQHALWGKKGHYCWKHCMKLGETEEERQIIVDKTKQEMIVRRKEFIEKDTQIINGIKIYTIDGKKYKMDSNNKLHSVCPFDGCSNYGVSSRKHKHCTKHRDGTDPNSKERLEETRIKQEEYKIKSKECTRIGDDTEIWLCNLMQILDTINSAKRIGQNCGKIDIIYKMNNENIYRGVQVKTLMQGRNESYRMNFKDKKGKRLSYDDNTLIIGINKNRNRFIITFAK